MDRWSIVTDAELPAARRRKSSIVLAKAKHYNNEKGRKTIANDGARRRPDPQRLHATAISRP